MGFPDKRLRYTMRRASGSLNQVTQITQVTRVTREGSSQMRHIDTDAVRGRITRLRPGDELRDAQRELEKRLRDLIAEFGAATGAWVAAVHVEYLGQSTEARLGSGDILVRTTLET